MKRIPVAIALLLGWSAIAAFALPKEGQKAPAFTVTSGDDRALSLEQLRGRVVILFYEDKDDVEKNRKLKEDLNRFYREQTDTVRAQVARVPVIDCRNLVWPITVVWRKNLVANSKKEGLVIYGDWNGEFAAAYGIVPDETQLIIIDQAGRVRYARAGLAKEKEIATIENLLSELVTPAP